MKTELMATTQTGVVFSNTGEKELTPFHIFIDMLKDLKDDEVMFTEATPEQICQIERIYGIRN